jgi:hypothetical protein
VLSFRHRGRKLTREDTGEQIILDAPVCCRPAPSASAPPPAPPFSGTVATFTTPDLIDSATAFSATITWGDGSSSSGLISSKAVP